MDAATGTAGWLGRSRTEHDELALSAVQRLAAMLDRDPGAIRRGDDLPESWYAILFGEVARQSEIGRDGHAETGDFIPPLPNRRRMFAGRRCTFHRPLRIGDDVTRRSTISTIREKQGGTGPFTLVTVVHEISDSGGLAVTEEQDIVYRAESQNEAAKPQEKPASPKDEPEWSEAWTPDTVILFRYSALTYNAHRIHYDLPYAREVEGYPGLVVNGGLTTLMLAESAKARLGRPIAGYAARAIKPLFIGMGVTLAGRRTEKGARMWAARPDGTEAFRLDVTTESAR